jgi:hypothetical protein
VFKLFGAGSSFIEETASPVKVNAALRVTLFFFEDVVNRNSVFKVNVGLVGAFKDVMAFILIYYGS